MCQPLLDAQACSAFTRVTACTLAPSPYFVTASPKASTVSLPPQLPRLLPAGAVAGWDSHPLESAAFHGAPRKQPVGNGREGGQTWTLERSRSRFDYRRMIGGV